jgi:hypothetical protein
MLSTNQALIVQELHEAHERGLRSVSREQLLSRLGSPNSRVRDSFKSGDGPRVWKSLIISNRKGMYSLNLPYGVA